MKRTHLSLLLLSGLLIHGCGCPDDDFRGGGGGGFPFPQPTASPTRTPQPVVALVPRTTESEHADDQRLFPDISPNAQLIAFDSLGSGSNPNGDILRLNRQNSALVVVNRDSADTPVLGGSSHARGSSDFQAISFHSAATALVAGDTNGLTDVFVKNLANSQIQRVSISTGSAQGDGFSGFASISRDANRVAFESDATNLVANDTNALRDVFVRQIDNDTTTLVSADVGGVVGNGRSGNSAISGDGSVVAFLSESTNLVALNTNGLRNVFLKNLASGVVTLISVGQGNTAANAPSASILINDDVAVNPNGRFVVFSSLASNLVDNDDNQTSDIFLRDTTNQTTRRVSVASNGTQSNGVSLYPGISDDGRFIVFESTATNLDGPDNANFRDVFIFDTTTGQCRRLSKNFFNEDPNAHCLHPRISGDGTLIVFSSDASDLVPGDDNNRSDLFTAANPFL